MKIVASKRRSVVREPALAYPDAARVYYIESSALLAALLEEDADVRGVLETGARVVTSALTFAECARGIVRGRASGRLTDREAQSAKASLGLLQPQFATIPISDAVLERAGRPFPSEPVRSLDAIHLASLESLGAIRKSVVVVTRDRRVRANAVDLGFEVA